MKKIVSFLLLSVLPVSSAMAYDTLSAIDKHIAYLKTLHENYYRAQDNSSRDAYGAAQQYSYFKHPRITSCITAIAHDKNLQPFFALWESVKREQSHDERLLEECTLLGIVFFNNIMNALAESHHKDENNGGEQSDAGTDVTVEEIIELYHRLSAMSLGNLIQLLSDVSDIVAERLAVSPAYHQRLFAWLRIPWWQPVIFIGAFVYHWFHGRDMQGDSSSCDGVIY